jgi:hypothetical protein
MAIHSFDLQIFTFSDPYLLFLVQDRARVVHSHYPHGIGEWS